MGNLRWLGLLLFVACQGDLDGGEVTDLFNSPEHTTTSMHCTTSGKTTMCMPIITHHDAQYAMDITACITNVERGVSSGPTPRPGNTCHTVRYNIGEGLYSQLRVGSWWGKEHPTYTPPPRVWPWLRWVLAVAALGFICVGLYKFYEWQEERRAREARRTRNGVPKAKAYDIRSKDIRR